MIETALVAAGDSISLDLYPEIDYLQRTGRAVKALGPASLLYSNADEVWPAFRGKDLKSRGPAGRFVMLASDGATVGTARHVQLADIPRAARVLTLTVGGNDLLLALIAAPDRAALEREVERVQREFRALVDELAATRPRLLILNKIYDPTDGTGRLLPFSDKLPLELLDSTNAFIRETASAVNAELADIHEHFLGHGATASAHDMWYWPESIIEPGYRAASEVRALWWEILERRGVV